MATLGFTRADFDVLKVEGFNERMQQIYARVRPRLIRRRFRANEVRVWLSLITHNLGNLWWRLVLPARIGNCSLTSSQQRPVKTGGAY